MANPQAVPPYHLELKPVAHLDRLDWPACGREGLSVVLCAALRQVHAVGRVCERHRSAAARCGNARRAVAASELQHARAPDHNTGACGVTDDPPGKEEACVPNGPGCSSLRTVPSRGRGAAAAARDFSAAAQRQAHVGVKNGCQEGGETALATSKLFRDVLCMPHARGQRLACHMQSAEAQKRKASNKGGQTGA